ncbi:MULTISPECIES: ABC transporter ATP-binding protein [unclassified Francisella]|uniref:ABC transporter ATP-binding protein n=1 Tax=unclassified Francisella TaxID=2610885 RepID=UPI002E361BEF|nr:MULTISPECIES: dipeptide ABC transporter ATP-binding protein [unclassified Francisella]MED7818877.1 dipeptide ABC transporter ATP-binding protein [Francisella sp. 19S2-4]MED7829668.1 dipeptide ABC transporter ATP-binding protein [Francisella sp. 19S2-10]
MTQDFLLNISDLKIHFPLKKAWPWKETKYVKAVDGVSFDVVKGETLGIVGESGCGKSTLIRAIVGLVNATEGKVVWAGKDLTALKTKKEWQPVRKDIQMVFQDPFASLNPRITIGNIIAEPLRVHEPNLSSKERLKKVEEIMKLVGLSPKHVNRYPHQFSGGQCQRVGIARALILKPTILVCDEPVSALDVSIQAQIVNLLKDLQKTLNLTILFIAHNLSVVKHISDRIMVMYLGNVMEVGESKSLCDNPQHPYTKALLSAVPLPDPDLERNKKIQILEGDLPSPINPPSGCVFRTRCPIAVSECATLKPSVTKVSDTRKVACIRA